MNAKKIILALATVACAICVTSCIATKVAKEDDQIEKGELFLIGRAQILYNNGITYSFNNKGQNQRIDKVGSDESILYLGKKKYVLDNKNKTYSTSEYVDGVYMEEFVVREYELSIDPSKEKEQVDIAGQKCTMYKEKYDSNEEVASYKRIRMHDKHHTSGVEEWHNISAILFTTSFSDDLFSLNGYTQQ